VFHWLDFRLTRTIQLHIDPCEYRRQIASDLGIPGSHDTISFLFKPKLSFAIAPGSFIVIVMPAVEFNDETPSQKALGSYR